MVGPSPISRAPRPSDEIICLALWETLLLYVVGSSWIRVLTLRREEVSVALPSQDRGHRIVTPS